MKDTVRLENKKSTLIVGHRGASGVERENTAAAFVAAGNRSYFGAECDVHVTKDGRYIVYHDDRTGRLCDRDVVIEETDFEELRKLKIKDSGAETFSEVFTMPTLEEYLYILSRYEKTAVIELKNRMDIGNIREITEICAKFMPLNKVIFISFDFDNLVDVRKLLPAQTVQYLVDKIDDGLIAKLAEHKMDIDTHWSALTKEVVEKLHGNGIKINSWTCDDPNLALKLIDWGVDYLTSNVLE